MSQESLEKFIIDVEGKKELQDILAKGGDMKDKQAKCEYVAEKAKVCGYDFTADEFLEWTKKEASKSGDLSDGDLDSVAGGEETGSAIGGFLGGAAGASAGGPAGTAIGTAIGTKVGDLVGDAVKSEQGQQVINNVKEKAKKWISSWF